MKKIIITIIIFLCVITNCIAQDGLPNDGDNITNVNINKFIGTWYWSNGIESLKIVLNKENVLLPFGKNIRADALYGFHIYTKNGIIVENSIDYINTTYKDKKHTLYAIGGYENQSNTLIIGFTHLSKNKGIRATIEMKDSSHINIVKLENYEGIRFGKFDWSISLPQNITLTKQ